MFFLELCTGLRKGELVALRWEDLDTEKRSPLSPETAKAKLQQLAQIMELTGKSS